MMIFHLKSRRGAVTKAFATFSASALPSTVLWSRVYSLLGTLDFRAAYIKQKNIYTYEWIHMLHNAGKGIKSAHYRHGLVL